MAIGLNKKDYQKFGLIAAGGTSFAIFSLSFMAALIATGDVSLDDINTRKIADFLMPERELELMDDSMERPEEQEPHQICCLQTLKWIPWKIYLET